MFGDDSFMGIDDLFNQLTKSRRGSYQKTQPQNQSILNTIETNRETILIFDLSGKRVESVRLKDDIEINEYGERVHNGQKLLVIEFENNSSLKYNLSNTSKRKISHTFYNGILEVYLTK